MSSSTGTSTVRRLGGKQAILKSLIDVHDPEYREFPRPRPSASGLIRNSGA